PVVGTAMLWIPGPSSLTLNWPIVEAESAVVLSTDVAVTCSVKLLGTEPVSVRPSRSAAFRYQVSFSSVPAESDTPVGTPSTVTDKRSEPSVSTRPAAIPNGTGVLISPVASCTFRVGAAAAAKTSRVKVYVDWLKKSPSLTLKPSDVSIVVVSLPSTPR